MIVFPLSLLAAVLLDGAETPRPTVRAYRAGGPGETGIGGKNATLSEAMALRIARTRPGSLLYVYDVHLLAPPGEYVAYQGGVGFDPSRSTRVGFTLADQEDPDSGLLSFPAGGEWSATLVECRQLP